MRVQLLRNDPACKEALEKLGYLVLMCPLIEIQKEDISLDPQGYTDLIFTSQNALFALKCWEFPAKVFAVGKKTASLIPKECLVPESQNQEGLLELIGENLKGRRFLWPAGKLAKDTLRQVLEERGAIVDRVNVYMTKSLEPLLDIQDGDVVLFTSSSIVQSFFSNPAWRGQKIHPFALGKECRLSLAKELNYPVHWDANGKVEELIQELIKELPPCPTL